VVGQLAPPYGLGDVVAAALKRIGVRALAVIGPLLGFSSLLLLSRSVENSTRFGRWQPWILLFNLCGVVFLAVVLARKVWQLVRDFRAHVPGSRLTARTVSVFGVLVIVPLLVVYLFSLEFLNRGIDSWFRVEVKQGLGDALVLSRAALDLRMREQGRRTEDFARQLANEGGVSLASSLDAERRRTGALEIIVFGRNGEVQGASTAGTDETLHARPPTELLLQVRENRPYVSLEPATAGGYVISTAAPIPDVPRAGTRFVLALYDVPQQLSALSEAVQSTYSQYGDLATLREPLKNSFRVTLTLVLLLTMLVAIYLAITFAQRMTRPVQDLIEGTRAVGKGDFATRLPLPSRDEMGFLVHSFNDMTKRLRRAREEATRSQQIVEQQRQRLAVILARLSTGVMVVDPLLGVRIANEAAGSILGTDLTGAVGRHLPEVAAGHERLTHFIAAISDRLREHRSEWREQIALPPDRVITCACTPLAEEAGELGYVIVFDDITLLLQVQRDAAWGEVARRLAHEIKNPLTPIQLSAERLQRRLAGKLPIEDGEVLNRSTDTIVQQVEALKQMVNAFSEYARAPELKFADFDPNALVREVVELYRGQDPAIEIRVQADPELTRIRADRSRLRQVLNNLITNGIEALGEAGGWVEVATGRVNNPAAPQAVITVSDNGHGFQKDMLARVFDPYVTSKQKGTGLGLAIVKKITEEHGGRIEADNRPEGGARVRLVLPMAAGLVSEQPEREMA
jgi:nitrogen fixation/metabolism regulation signal transduction histidine kinase